MRYGATEPLPDYRFTQPDPKEEEPDRPEGDIKETMLIGVTMDGKRIKLDHVEVFAEWENGYTGRISLMPNDPQLKDKLNSEV
jgi:hypothetical protein